MPTDDDHLRQFLAERDSPCPRCAYSLRGLTTDRCPECDAALRLQVGLVEPRLAAFITGLVFVASGLGFCLLLSIYVAYWTVMRRGPGLPREFIVVVVGSVVSLVLLPVWLRLRRRIGRMSAPSRWMLVALAGVISLACPAVFIVTVR